ncbi:GFA family protein [Gammaproteobacteria bacterium]|nr:GFA family protein [Gammaproteobacteria bacterium]
MKIEQQGRCQCKKISYSFEHSKLISAHHCHCLDCQRATGSGKATIMIVPKKHLKLEGELKYFEVKGSSGSHIRRGFCEHCGSGILSYAKEVPHILYIKAGTLDNSSWLKIDSNFFTDSSHDWNEPSKAPKSFKRNPTMSSNFITLLKSFK